MLSRLTAAGVKKAAFGSEPGRETGRETESMMTAHRKLSPDRSFRALGVLSECLFEEKVVGEKNVEGEKGVFPW